MNKNLTIWFVAIGLLIEVIAIVIMLIAIALNKVQWLPDSLSMVAVCILFGGLGGCTYCLRGVYLNACVLKTWDISWLPWYFIRPFVSLILGGVSYLFVKSGLLLFGASQQPDASQLGIWSVAFLAGLNVDKFVNKVESIGQTVWGLDPSRQSKQNSQNNDSESKKNE